MIRFCFSVLLSALFVAIAWFDVIALAEAPSGPTAGFGKRRTWSDKSGKFKVDAKLAEANSDSIQLLKDDGREVKIPLASMSESDRMFVESFLDAAAAMGDANAETEINPFAGGELKGNSNPKTPPTKRLERSATAESDDQDSSGSIPVVKFQTSKGKPIAINYDLPMWKGSQVSPFKLPEVADEVIKLPITKKFFDGVSMAVGGVNRTAVVSVYNVAKMQKETFARLGSLNLKDSEPTVIGSWEEPWKIYSMSADAKQFAAVIVSTFDKGNELAVFESTSEGKYAPLFRFTAGGGDWDEVLWAGFLSTNRLATISQKSTLTIWDLESKRVTHQGSTSGVHTAAIGGRGELIALPSNSGIALIRGDDGKQVGLIPVKSSFPPSVAFSPSGESLAVYTPFNVSIYRLTDGQLTQSIWVNESSTGSIQWLGSYVLLNNKLLIDSEKGIPVWTYNIQNAQSTAVFGGQLFSLFAGENGGALIAYKLPHLDVDDLAKSKSAEEIYCIRPGSSFRVTSRWNGMSPDEQKASESAVVEQLVSLGWVQDSNSENEVVISLEQGDLQEVDYYSSDGRFGPIGFGFGRPSGPATRISERSWKYSIVIKHQGKDVHQSAYTVGLPNGVQLKEGETTVQAVQRLMKPSPSFFKNTRYPQKILKPEFQGGFGKSTITEKGIN